MISKKDIELAMSSAISGRFQWLKAKQLSETRWGLRCGYEDRIRYHTHDGYSGSTWKRKSFNICILDLTTNEGKITVDVILPRSRNQTFNRKKFGTALALRFKAPLVINYHQGEERSDVEHIRAAADSNNIPAAV